MHGYNLGGEKTENLLGEIAKGRMLKIWLVVTGISVSLFNTSLGYWDV